MGRATVQKSLPGVENLAMPLQGKPISDMFAERRGAVDGELGLENQADMDDLTILAMLTLLSEPWFNHF